MNLELLYNKIKKLETTNKIEKEEILKELEIEILTGGKVNKGIISIMKRIQKENVNRPVFQGLYKTIKGNYCICNGRILIDYGKNKDNIPKELLPYINEENQGTTIDYEYVYNNYADKEVKINFKNVEKLSKYNKLHKENPVDLPVENILVNPDLILDLVKLSGIKEIENIKFFISNNVKDPINIKFNENIKGIILPIFIEEELKLENNKKYNEIINQEV